MHPKSFAQTALLLLALAAAPSLRAAEPIRFGDAPQAAAWKQVVLERGLPVADAAADDLRLESSAVNLRLDAFGSFGSSTAGEDAQFDDGSRTAGTVFEYMVHARGIGFLDSEALLLPPHWSEVVRDGSAVTATYELGAFRFEVRSELGDCDRPNCAWLVQEYAVTNVSAEPAALELTPYLDGDLFFAGDFNNDYGARSGDTLYQFDEGSDPAAPSTFLGLETDAPGALRVVREVGEYSELRRRIKQGGLLIERFSRADGSVGDADGDQVTDAGFDVSLAASHDFGELAPGERAVLSVRLQWGLGALDDLDEVEPLVADAGPDQLLECEGRDGTLALLDGSASGPADLVVAHRWLLGGDLVAEGAVADLLLMPGVHELTLEVEDAEGRLAQDEVLVTVLDTEGPIVEVGEPVVLWPPSHRLVEVVPPVRLHDACSDSVSLQVTQVLVDEGAEVRRGGDGHHAPDAVLTEDGRLLLRAERQGGGDGRVYQVLAVARDEAGNAERVVFQVQVPHSPGEAAVPSGTVQVVRF